MPLRGPSRALLMLTVLVWAGAASADALLLGTTGRGQTPSTLYEVDPQSGATTLIGEVGYVVNGMDAHEGVLYGTTSSGDPNHHGLITIDPVTGAGSPVGSGWGTSRPDLAVAELAIDSAGNAYSWSVPELDDATAIDLDAGLVMGVVGDSGLDAGELGLSFDTVGDLYFIAGDVGGVYRIDTSDGSSSFVGNLGVPSAHHGDVDPDTGIYYGLGSPSTKELRSVDLASATLLGTLSTDRDLHTLAFLPEPSRGALLVAGVLGLAALRRRPS